MRTSLLTRVVPLVAVAAFAGSASAQDIVSNGVSAAGEAKPGMGITAVGAERAALFTSSAFVAPKGAKGFSVQAIGTRSSADVGGEEIVGTESNMVLSGFYGITNRLSLGAYVPYTRVGLEIGGESGSESGLGDAGVFGRFQAYRSQSGATKFALGAGVTLPTGDDLFTADDPTYAINGALSHTAGKWNFHAVPQVRMVTDLDPFINLNVAAVRMMSDRLSWTGELLTQFGGAVSDVDGAEGDQDIDLASGIRYRMAGRSALDFGLRYNVASNLDPKPTTLGMYLGWNFAF